MNLQGHRNDTGESRPGYLWLCHWCVQIMQECDFHVKPLGHFLVSHLKNACEWAVHYPLFMNF